MSDQRYVIEVQEQIRGDWHRVGIARNQPEYENQKRRINQAGQSVEALTGSLGYCAAVNLVQRKNNARDAQRRHDVEQKMKPLPG